MLKVFLGIPTSPLVLDRTQPALIGTRVLGLRLGLQSCEASVMQPAGHSLHLLPAGARYQSSNYEFPMNPWRTSDNSPSTHFVNKRKTKSGA
jgi:hypothetical protein